MMEQTLVIPILCEAIHDESSFVKVHAEAALDDIRMFCPSNE